MLQFEKTLSLEGKREAFLSCAVLSLWGCFFTKSIRTLDVYFRVQEAGFVFIKVLSPPTLFLLTHALSLPLSLAQLTSPCTPILL